MFSTCHEYVLFTCFALLDELISALKQLGLLDSQPLRTT
jgi:hypothetical protein